MTVTKGDERSFTTELAQVKSLRFLCKEHDIFTSVKKIVIKTYYYKQRLSSTPIF